MHKKYILKVVVFAFFILTLLEVIFVLLASYDEFIRSVKNLRFGMSECVIMGDSHTAAGFENEIKKCENLSKGGATIPMIRDAIVSASKTNNLKIVILSLSPHNFCQSRLDISDSNFRNISEYFIPYYNPSFLNPLIRRRYVLLLKKILKIKEEEPLEIYNISEKEKEKIKDKILISKPVLNFNETSYANIYLELTKELVAKKTKVCFIRMPVHKIYEDEMSKNFNIDDWNRFIKILESNGAKYIDYNNLNIDIPIYYFRNEDHLNKNGAKFFAPIAYEACLD